MSWPARIIWIPLGVGIVFALGACERASDPGNAPADRKAAAARRGIDWLIDQQESMSAEWAIAVFSYLYKIVEDEELARSIGAILDERSASPIVPLPPTLRSRRVLRVLTLGPILAELVRRKQVGEPYEQSAKELEETIRRNEGAFWRRLHYTQQLVFLHAFSELGIETSRTLEAVVQDLRSAWERGDPDELLVDRQFMFGVTHVFSTASGYFSHYPSPQRFEVEREILRRALRRYLSGPVPDDRYFLEIQGEVLIARKLLRLPEDGDAEAMVERLLDLQHEDGSWGEAVGKHPLHATIVMVEALLDYPPRFRPLPPPPGDAG